MYTIIESGNEQFVCDRHTDMVYENNNGVLSLIKPNLQMLSKFRQDLKEVAEVEELPEGMMFEDLKHKR